MTARRAIAVALLAAACGVKAPPRPPLPEKAPAGAQGAPAAEASGCAAPTATPNTTPTTTATTTPTTTTTPEPRTTP